MHNGLALHSLSVRAPSSYDDGGDADPGLLIGGDRRHRLRHPQQEVAADGLLADLRRETNLCLVRPEFTQRKLSMTKDRTLRSTQWKSKVLNDNDRSVQWGRPRACHIRISLRRKSKGWDKLELPRWGAQTCSNQNSFGRDPIVIAPRLLGLQSYTVAHLLRPNGKVMRISVRSLILHPLVLKR